MQKVFFIDTGIKHYSNAWEYQRALVKKVQSTQNQNYLIFAEHPPVITVGKSSEPNNLLTEKKQLESLGIELSETDRGGDITFHGPGQIVCYPIFNLNNFKKDIHWYLRSLEEVIIQTVKKYKIDAGRISKLTGVWVNDKKICAIGVKISRWVTMHGFALNVSTDLSYFKHIIPCGINGKGVTSILYETGKSISVEKVKKELILTFKNIFQIEVEKWEYIY